MLTMSYSTELLDNALFILGAIREAEAFGFIRTDMDIYHTTRFSNPFSKQAIEIVDIDEDHVLFVEFDADGEIESQSVFQL